MENIIKTGIKLITTAAVAVGAGGGRPVDTQQKVQEDLAGKAGKSRTEHRMPASQLGEMGYKTSASEIPGNDEAGKSRTEQSESKKILHEFESVEEALVFLESTEGTSWMQGNASKESEYFPWRSKEAWDIFGNLTTWGHDPHPVYLVPNDTNSTYSILGIESDTGNTVIDYVDKAGNPGALRVKGDIELKILLGKDYLVLSINRPTVWEDFYFPDGNAEPRISHPEKGVTDGFVTSTDHTRRHYFQGSGKQP